MQLLNVDQMSWIVSHDTKFSYQQLDMFVKRGCHRRQQSQNMAKSLGPTFWPHPNPRGMRYQLEWGCPNRTKYPRGNHLNSPSYAPERGSSYALETIFSNPCIVTLTFDLLTPKYIIIVHIRLMGRLHVKLHEDRCKAEAVMRQKPFSVILALWPWPLTFWPQSP